MNIYRIMIWHESEHEAMTILGVTVTKEPQFFSTNLELNPLELFDQGLSVKKMDNLPDHIKVTPIS